MKVIVGSENPVKTRAVKAAFKKVWPKKNFEVSGVKIESNVRDQPTTDAESIRGATHRAKKALSSKDADFGVGIEGGLQKIGNKWFDCGWCVVINKKGIVGMGSSARIEISSKLLKLIQSKGELGLVLDAKFAKKFGKQKSGYFGLMTNEVITRRSGYVDGVIFALSRFLHPELF